MSGTLDISSSEALQARNVFGAEKPDGYTLQNSVEDNHALFPHILSISSSFGHLKQSKDNEIKEDEESRFYIAEFIAGVSAVSKHAISSSFNEDLRQEEQNFFRAVVKGDSFIGALSVSEQSVVNNLLKHSNSLCDPNMEEPDSNIVDRLFLYHWLNPKGNNGPLTGFLEDTFVDQRAHESIGTITRILSRYTSVN